MNRERDFDTSGELIGNLCAELLASGVTHETLADALMVKAMAFWGVSIGDENKPRQFLTVWANERDAINGN
ncbi:hypothetical protein DK867_12780 [Ochrobactrum sp. POC9]|uniref:hypothetical protein n=1 Tax=Ochrobactrum sp. POC9 TaxID=2203419 RepID=UPI000D705D97|nr:hypothetical protein [Ochrobactrum sp. POC9]PWU72745.1 hypothetical protein DK867_12780 [Ochrobactrum sp. POC9]